MYAWSRFPTDVDEWGKVSKWINPGDKISKSDLGISDEEWQELIDIGAVREEAYPDIPSSVAPADYFREHPDEAPEVKVDKSTPSEEAVPKLDAGMSQGMKLPGSDDKEKAQSSGGESTNK